jgi:hypothetical protein
MVFHFTKNPADESTPAACKTKCASALRKEKREQLFWSNETCYTPSKICSDPFFESSKMFSNVLNVVKKSSEMKVPQARRFSEQLHIYISLQLCKMTDARASHINAKQGTMKAQNTIKQGQLKKAIKPI